MEEKKGNKRRNREGKKERGEKDRKVRLKRRRERRDEEGCRVETNKGKVRGSDSQREE